MRLKSGINNRKIDRADVDSIIDEYLYYVREGSIEAPISLQPILRYIFEAGVESYEWNSVKRLTGVLSTIFLIYYYNKAVFYDEMKTRENMLISICDYVSAYRDEDKKFIEQNFAMNGEIGYLTVFLEQQLTSSSEKHDTVSGRFFEYISRLKVAGKYDDALNLNENGFKLFAKYMDDETEIRLLSEKCDICFRLGNNEKAREIYEQNSDRFMKSNDASVLYNGAVYYIWSAGKKERNTSDYISYINIAESLIERAEWIIKQGQYEYVQYALGLEKAHLLSEKGNYDWAYKCLKEIYLRIEKVISNDEHNYDVDKNAYTVMKSFDFEIIMWIILNYIQRNKTYSDRIEDAIDLLQKIYIKYRRHFREDFLMILDFIFDKDKFPNVNNMDDIIKALFMFVFYVNKIWYMTEVRDISQYDVLYYTPFKSLKFLLDDEELGDTHYRLSLFNVDHMNDPEEGQILNEQLARFCEKKLDKASSVDRHIYSYNRVYLKSFYSYSHDEEGRIKEFLPMWYQYADEAKGCCVALDSRTFKNTSLRRVIYLTDDGHSHNKKNNVTIKALKYSYRELMDVIEAGKKHGKFPENFICSIQNIIEIWISKIAFLFKRDTYEHEQEVRLIETLTDADNKRVKTIEGDIPKTFIYNESASYINEVILGARLNNPEDYAPYIYKQGAKMWADKNGMIKVTHSALRFR